MAHPSGRDARRAARRRIIARRLARARATWYWWGGEDPAPAHPARWAKWNPFVCCAMCQYDTARPARWRWDGVLVGHDLELPPPRLEGMDA